MERDAKTALIFNPGLLFGVAAALIAGTLLAFAFSIPVRPTDPILGPRLFPLVITAGLLVLTLIYAASVVSNPGSGQGPAQAPVNWRGVGFVLGGVVLFAVLVGTVGFVLAEAVLFVCVARAFRSESLLWDVGIGLVLALTVFILFTAGLGLRLPAGLLAPLSALWS